MMINTSLGKYILLMLGFLVSSITLHAQDWSGSTPGSIYYNSGNVGIGISLPKSKLDLGTNYSNPGTYPNKITLWSGGVNNYFGFGISSGDLDYFSQGNHRFYTQYNGTPGTEKMVINSHGRVGIGVSDPGGYILNAAGSAKIGGNLTGTQLRLEATDEAGAPATSVRLQLHGYEGRGKGIFISDKNTSHNWFIGEGYNYAGIGIGYNTSSSQTEYAVNTKLYIHPSGNIGIGNMSPRSKLDLGNNYSNPGSYPNKITLWSGGVNNYFGFGISSGDLDYFSQGNHRFYTGYNGTPGTEKMVIKSNGHVGIGVADPGGYMLNTAGSAKIGGNLTGTQLRLEATDEAGAPATSVRLQLHGYEGRGKGIFISDKNTSHNWFIGEGYNYAGIGIGYNTSSSQTEYAVNTKLYIHPSGRIGIGTMSPDESLTVRGTVHTNEVRVDADARVVPDYVFEPDYDLMSLADIKKYINKEKHLPEVPSGADMEADGINLKEMNLLLLKKVEELTLHAIAQGEEIRELKKDMRAVIISIKSKEQ